jgi:hypothetical protein
MPDKIMLLDRVNTPDGSLGRVSELDVVDDHIMANVNMIDASDGEMVSCWYKANDLTKITD